MKKNILIIIFILLYYSTNTYSQNKDSIIYIFPDKVEQKLYEQIKKKSISDCSYFEFYLQAISKDTFRITYSYSKGIPISYWAKNTNRFILINEHKYPLIFDYDTRFSTSEPNKIGKYGHREGTIMRHLIIYEGYNITFRENGEYVEENFGLYIEK